MAALRLTAVMKTDISGSTPHFRALGGADLAAALAGHRDLIVRLGAAREGRIVKAEGDSFWIVFPSVTAAAQAAIAMQEESARGQTNKGDDRWAMRIVITVGDVLHEEGDLFGDAVALAARIEAVTPADEIYLSAAARLAVNQAEVRTALVDALALKGFTEPVPVYRVEQRHRTQILRGQYILFADLHGFSPFVATAEISVVERVLDRLLQLVSEVCREFTGVNRFSAGDAHCLTFADAEQAMAAAARLTQNWHDFHRRESITCSMTAVLHKGTLSLFRSYLHSQDLNIAIAAADAVKARPDADGTFFLTGAIAGEVVGSAWQPLLEPLEAAPASGTLAGVALYRVGFAVPN
jgi:adenylate cyclase